MSAKEIYAALIRKDWEMVKSLCSQNPNGPFVKISRTGDSVLQKAFYAGEVDLVLGLLEVAKTRFREPRAFQDKLLGDVNSAGNTILHEAATQDSCVHAATSICGYAENLLFTKNKKGEFPIFSAARYGQLNMFKFLHSKYTHHVPDKDILNSFYYKLSDERETYTILHVAIYNEHFELALHIATTIRGLICEKDHQQMTGLHMLAMNSSAFRIRYWEWLKFLLPSPFGHISVISSPQTFIDHDVEDAIYRDVEVEVEDAPGTINAFNHKLKDVMKFASRFTMTIAYWSKVKNEHRRYKAARKLGSILVKYDTEWIDELEDVPDADEHSEENNSGSASPENKYDTEWIDELEVVSDADDHSEENNSGSASPENLGNADEESVKQQEPQSVPISSHYGENVNSDADENSGGPPTPLILATKYGCVDIALEIIKEHPQTVEQVDRKFGSILHLAIKYRRKEILDAVKESTMQMRRLVRLLDEDQNSILHMVALNTVKVKAKNGSDNSVFHAAKVKVESGTEPPRPWDAEELRNESRSPAFILQDDLLLFESVEDIIRTQYHTIPNKALETPEQLFAANKETLRVDAQEWMKRTAENCSIVAVLIATVAFAAAYTVPGGNDDKNGSPLLLKEAFFVVFTTADVLSLTSTLTAVVVFLSILTSSYRLEDFKGTLPTRLMLGILCLVFSLTMMMLAFAATIILMIKNKQQWTKIALYAVAFLPVTVLAATYLPYFNSLMQTFIYILNKAKLILPTITPLRKKIGFLQGFLFANPEKPTVPSIQV